MAMLRPLTKKILNGCSVEYMHSKEVFINEEERYEVAKRMFEEDRELDYIYYFSDWAVAHNAFYTYPISRASVGL